MQAANPGVYVGEFGGASADKALAEGPPTTSRRRETLSLPITLLILVLAFGALVAAGVPLLLGLSAVFATLGLVALPSQIFPLGDDVASIVLLVGLAVGVDYTLFYLRREREERAAGATKLEAIHTAAATSGRAVLISGMTVIVAMAGLFLAGDKTFSALGLGAITVVLVAMIGSVTVVPAVLSLLGDRVERGRVPFLHRLRRSDGESRLWSLVLDRVLKRPAISAFLATGRAARARLPGPRNAHRALAAPTTCRATCRSCRSMTASRPPSPAARSRPSSRSRPRTSPRPSSPPRSRTCGDKAFATGRFNGPVDVTVSQDRHVAQIAIPIKGNGTDAVSNAGLADLRDSLVAQTVGPAPGVKHAYVAGMTAETKDYTTSSRAARRWSSPSSCRSRSC